jgi:hypothetical protein
LLRKTKIKKITTEDTEEHGVNTEHIRVNPCYPWLKKYTASTNLRVIGQMVKKNQNQKNNHGGHGGTRSLRGVNPCFSV